MWLIFINRFAVNLITVNHEQNKHEAFEVLPQGRCQLCITVLPVAIAIAIAGIKKKSRTEIEICSISKAAFILLSSCRVA